MVCEEKGFATCKGPFTQAFSFSGGPDWKLHANLWAGWCSGTLFVYTHLNPSRSGEKKKKTMEDCVLFHVSYLSRVCTKKKKKKNSVWGTIVEFSYGVCTTFKIRFRLSKLKFSKGQTPKFISYMNKTKQFHWMCTVFIQEKIGCERLHIIRNT